MSEVPYQSQNADLDQCPEEEILRVYLRAREDYSDVPASNILTYLRAYLKSYVVSLQSSD